MKTTVVGFIGTGLAYIASISLTEWGTIAAISAGFGTCAWMVTQMALSIEARVHQRRQERAQADKTPSSS